MPLADAIAFTFAGPIIVAGLAPFFLGERVDLMLESGLLNEAKEEGIAPNIAVFALMECLQLIISSNVKDRSMAIAEFEALATAFVQDWKKRE